MGTNLTKQSEEIDDVPNVSTSKGHHGDCFDNKFEPDISMFQGHDQTVGGDGAVFDYDSIDYALDDEEEENTERNMVDLMRTHGREVSLLPSRTTYIDLDLLTTLETRVNSLRDRNGCPIYYLGWTQQTTMVWPADTHPNSFNLDQARAIVLHLPPSIDKSIHFK